MSHSFFECSKAVLASAEQVILHEDKRFKLSRALHGKRWGRQPPTWSSTPLLHINSGAMPRWLSLSLQSKRIAFDANCYPGWLHFFHTHTQVSSRMHRFDALRTISPLSATSASNTTTSTIGQQGISSPVLSAPSIDIPLDSSWTTWSMPKSSLLSAGGSGSVTPASSNSHQQHSHQFKSGLTKYEQAIMPVSRFDSVDSFCAIYARLTRPASAAATTPMPVHGLLLYYRLYLICHR